MVSVRWEAGIMADFGVFVGAGRSVFGNVCGFWGIFRFLRCNFGICAGIMVVGSILSVNFG